MIIHKSEVICEQNQLEYAHVDQELDAGRGSWQGIVWFEFNGLFSIFEGFGRLMDENVACTAVAGAEGNKRGRGDRQE